MFKRLLLLSRIRRDESSRESGHWKNNSEGKILEFLISKNENKMSWKWNKKHNSPLEEKQKKKVTPQMKTFDNKIMFDKRKCSTTENDRQKGLLNKTKILNLKLNLEKWYLSKSSPELDPTKLCFSSYSDFCC